MDKNNYKKTIDSFECGIKKINEIKEKDIDIYTINDFFEAIQERIELYERIINGNNNISDDHDNVLFNIIRQLGKLREHVANLNYSNQIHIVEKYSKVFNCVKFNSQITGEEEKIVSEKDFERILELSNIQRKINEIENPTIMQKISKFLTNKTFEDDELNISIPYRKKRTCN